MHHHCTINTADAQLCKCWTSFAPNIFQKLLCQCNWFDLGFIPFDQQTSISARASLIRVTSDLCNRRGGCWPQRAQTAWWHHQGLPRWAWPRYPGANDHCHHHQTWQGIRQRLDIEDVKTTHQAAETFLPGSCILGIQSTLSHLFLCSTLCVCLTLRHCSDESSGDAAGTQDSSLDKIPSPPGQTPKSQRCNRCQEAHNCGLDLGRKDRA